MSKLSKQHTNGFAYPFEVMMEKNDLLERVELCFMWGRYQIRVLRWHLARFEPGLHIPFHKHSEFEFHFIPRGKGNVTIFNQPFSYDSGMFYLTGPGVVHEQRANMKSGMDELCLHLDITEAEAETSDKWEIQEADKCVEILKHFPSFPLPDQYDAMSCFLEAYLAWNEGNIGAYSILKHSVIQILIRSVQAVGSSALAFAYPERDIGYHRMQMALQFIHDNYAAPITLQEVSYRIGISARQLQRLFKKHADTSFSQYIEHYRLQRICEDLIHTIDTIEVIATRHGFVNSNYLFPVFKKRYRMTPLQYREQFAGEK